MRCPSCGAVSKKRSMKCSECGAFRNKSWVDSEPVVASPTDIMNQKPAPPKTRAQRSPSSTSLIEFPGAGRQAKPQWRKELGERVREVQEKRAREAMLAEGEPATQRAEAEPTGVRPLELLSRPEMQPTNPIVVAALRRIERAYTHSQFSGNNAVATAPAYEEQPAYGLELSAVQPQIADPQFEEHTQPAALEEVERTCHLSVVAPVITEHEPVLPEYVEEPVEPVVADVIEEPVVAADIEEPIVVSLSEDAGLMADQLALPGLQTRPVSKPKRLIRDNDPALNYLDTVPTTARVEVGEKKSAPVFLRMFSALLDLAVVCALSTPVVAIVKLSELPWRDPRVITFVSGTLLVATFLYLTVSTALTGRTLAMRLFSLRVVDARTGLIPTGTQSAGRSVLYILSFATAGLGFLYMFLDRERRTAHDRFTRTAVVRV